MLITEATEKKLQEAHFFLQKMTEHERMAFENKEQFDAYLSAFLTAGMSVRGAFHVRQDRKRNEQVKRWKEDWEARLTPNEERLYNFMHTDRNHEVHGGGSSRTVRTENRELGPGVHKLAGGTHEVSGLPGWSVNIPVPAYYFTIDGVERKAVEACGEYLALLRQMVAKFKADYP
ncbi:MAG TPA: hypothetical protein VG498_05235 [Terriglobales bacterium]|nr:hypothetical protein [Terriglobales bacterium]